jgi:long-chain acyl-CoA synthetase
MNAVDYFFEKTKDLKKLFVVGREEISFEDLHFNVLLLASSLVNEIGTGKNILLLSINNVFFITAYLAIIKSGNTCIPLDPNIEKDNFNYITNLTKPALAFMSASVSTRLSDESLKIRLPDEKDTKNSEIKSFPETDAQTVAEIIFTSGSTGKPKGVMLSHKNLVANTTSIIEYLKLGATDRMLVVLPFYYCYGLSLLHTHLRTGGSLVLNNSFIFLGSVINDLKKYRCTGFAGVPSHFQVLLRKSNSFKSTAFPDLRYVTQAGGKLSTVFIDEFKDAFPDTLFYVMYGQTEATARLSYLPPELYPTKKGSLGKGIPGVQLKVVDESGKEVNPGETGEIIASGDNIMKGYLNDPSETKKTIRNDWLYTGDLATVDEDGCIFHAARKKEILKAGGIRISPKEIEDVIVQLQEVVDCSIEGINDDILGESIKAIIVVNNIQDSFLNEEKVKIHCAKHLATYKIPQFIEFKNKMEVSSSGKKVKGNP